MYHLCVRTESCLSTTNNSEDLLAIRFPLFLRFLIYQFIDERFTMRYSKEDKIDMILIYGESRQCLREAVRLYKDRFPNRNCPSVSVYSNLINKFRETGSVENKKCTKVKTVRNEANTINVLAAVDINPHASTRQIARESGISKKCVLQMLHEQKFHPFHLSIHQELHGRDFANRVNFCQWGLRQLINDRAFFNKVLFTDEASFTNHGQINLKNMHYWSSENPRWLRTVDKQRPWSVNVWCGILNNQIIGPHFITGTLNAEKYIAFLRESLPILLENTPLDIREVMWYQHDGCPAHSSRVVTQFLNNKFQNRWIGRNGPVLWPARSPDLTPLDFYLWGKLKDDVYREPPTTVDDMKERIVRACASIPSEMNYTAVGSVTSRLNECIAAQGNIFEHLA